MSSSESWRGPRGRPADIIDLDKFMRGGVRPSREAPSVEHLCDRLVVDNGGPSLKVNAVPSRGSTSMGRPTVPPARAKHQKRYSHDSGLSDGSYTRRRHRPHRRVSGQEGGGPLRGTRAQRSSDSLRAFRAACERALLDQQKQIARVAQLCERLTVQRTERAERGHPPPSATPDSSDLSSSSRSTRDVRRKDKHRSQECKTYKIIMNKLDELNRLFAAGGRSPLARPSPPAPRARRTPSSGSVTVSDKVVATEPEIKKDHQIITSVQPCLVAQAQARRLVERGVGGRGGSAGGSREGFPAPRAARVLVAADSIVKQECSMGGSRSSKCDPRCGFDLDDPVHLYSQAKRLQALHASTRRRAYSADARAYAPLPERERAERRARESSLCALCRCYWRSLRQFVAGQLFCCPDNYKCT